MRGKAKASRLRRDITEMANGMRKAGLLDEAELQKITVRTAPGRAFDLIGGADVRKLRELANMSQAAFARVLNLTPGYVSQLERGEKEAKGATLALLHVVKRKGIDGVL